MDKKVLRWNFVFQYGYVLTNMINSFVLLPFYVFYIDEIQLGLWWATGNVLAWLTLSDPGIGDVLQQKIAELSGSGNRSEISRTIGSGLLATFFTFLLSILVGIGFYFLLGVFLNIDIHKYEDLELAFLVSVLSTGITLVTFALAGINQGLLRSKQVAISYILSNVLFFAVNLVLLFMGFQLMSIAIAAVVRALFLAIYNLIVIFRGTSSSGIAIEFDWKHFKGFIRIFSYTSLSKIITSFSNNIDLVILARYIAPQTITLFEINRRPIKMLQSLLGRYSVALMPSISFGIGKDREEVKVVVRRQFRLFLLMTLLFTGLSILCYEQLITLWISATKYAGNMILLLLVGNFLWAMIGYFLSNVVYAVGDIKNHSIVMGIKGIVLLTTIPIAAAFFGITGVLVFTLITSFLVDVCYFAFRLNYLGFFSVSTEQLKTWTVYLIVFVAAFTATYTAVWFSGITNVILLAAINSSLFIVLFFSGLFIADSHIKYRILNYFKG